MLNQTLQLQRKLVRATLFRVRDDVEESPVEESPATAVSEQSEQANPKTYGRAHLRPAELPAGLTEPDSRCPREASLEQKNLPTEPRLKR